MTPIDQATRTARAGQELLQASGDVIARRLEIVADGLRDPLRADIREMSLMGSEKVEALTASATAGLNGAMSLAATTAAAAARETAAAQGALNAVLTARNPAEAALAQGGWVAAAMGRAVSDGWAFGATMLKLQAETLAPIHAAAIANAKRLKR
ncbi:phasin family protein [Brevundimonas sp.]|uniref:phasin family protein n=1 Tax=Brevundimonas sp. TaxID=1871086 RepID=UPI002D71BD6B|nr:phasin family protein [Brevundimonas sp.]HYC97284.1 phasin family protein [Brevundimonas sp.]